MKISVEEVSRLLTAPSLDRAGNRPAAGFAEATRTDFTSGQAAHIDVSAKALEVQQVKNLVNQLPDVRESRVQALKAQVESGNYKVSGDDIADLIIRRVLADNVAL